MIQIENQKARTKKNNKSTQFKGITIERLGTERISENAKSDGWDVASIRRVARDAPSRFPACFTNCSMTSACCCSISMAGRPPFVPSITPLPRSDFFPVRKKFQYNWSVKRKMKSNEKDYFVGGGRKRNNGVRVLLYVSKELAQNFHRWRSGLGGVYVKWRV